MNRKEYCEHLKRIDTLLSQAQVAAAALVNDETKATDRRAYYAGDHAWSRIEDIRRFLIKVSHPSFKGGT